MVLVGHSLSLKPISYPSDSWDVPDLVITSMWIPPVILWLSTLATHPAHYVHYLSQTRALQHTSSPDTHTDTQQAPCSLCRELGSSPSAPSLPPLTQAHSGLATHRGVDQPLSVVDGAPCGYTNGDDFSFFATAAQAEVPDCLAHLLHHTRMGPSSDDPGPWGKRQAMPLGSNTPLVKPVVTPSIPPCT